MSCPHTFTLSLYKGELRAVTVILLLIIMAFTPQVRYTQTVRRVDFLYGDAMITPPTGERKYLYEAFGGQNRTRLTPVTFHQQEMQATRLTAIEDGDMHDAFIYHLATGKGMPSQLERQEYPWWAHWYERMITQNCTQCHLPLGEDRAVSRNCAHQLCTACACNQTALTWDAANRSTQCDECQRLTRYLIVNGEQCDDGRSHSDVIIFQLF